MSCHESLQDMHPPLCGCAVFASLQLMFFVCFAARPKGWRALISRMWVAPMHSCRRSQTSCKCSLVQQRWEYSWRSSPLSYPFIGNSERVRADGGTRAPTSNACEQERLWGYVIAGVFVVSRNYSQVWHLEQLTWGIKSHSLHGKCFRGKTHSAQRTCWPWERPGVAFIPFMKSSILHLNQSFKDLKITESHVLQCK